MTLKEAIEMDHSVYIDCIKRNMSEKDSEHLEDLITTLKKYAKILDESEWLIE